ncbi:MAG: MCE family protein [Actinomycetota bacterium]|nr:MCE family protein [Actinomycetota bacterium]
MSPAAPRDVPAQIADSLWARLWRFRGRWSGRRQAGGGRVLIKLAAFVALSVLLTTVVVASLLNFDTRSTVTYRALFTDDSTIQAGDQVMVAGVEVGRITGVRLVGTRALVSFALDHPEHVTSDTRAAIAFQNLFGNRYLALSDTTVGRPLPPGATIPASRTTPALNLTALFNGFQPLYQALTPSQINQLTANIVSTFQGEGGTIGNLVDETAQLTANLAQRGQVIDSVVTNLSALAQLVATHDAQLAQLIDNFDALASDIGGESQLVSSSLASAASATSSLSSLVGAVQPSFEHSVTGLTAVTGTLAHDQGALDALVAALPGLSGALARVGQNGTFFKIYLCEDTVSGVSGYGYQGPGGTGLYLGPVDSVLGIPVNDVPLLYVALKPGYIGGTPAETTHTRNCTPT